MEFKETYKFEHNEEDNLQSEILDLLDRHDIRLDPDRKDQHILTSREAINQLVNSAELTPDDVILEIGRCFKLKILYLSVLFRPVFL